MVGVPAVVTPVAAEGLDVVDGEGVFITDAPSVLAERIECLLRDDDEWQRVAQLGHDRIVRHNGRAAAASLLTRAFAQALNSGTEH